MEWNVKEAKMDMKKLSGVRERRKQKEETKSKKG